MISVLLLTALSILRFRNLEDLRWEPAPGLNLIVGDNGQGKTNVLDAIHYALLGRSFRTRRDEDCLPWDGGEEPEPTFIEAAIEKKSAPQTRRLLIEKGRKRIYVDGALAGRVTRLWEGSAVVTFSPADVDLLRDTPARRRRFLDFALSQSSPLYLHSLQRYQKALRELNALLKRSAGSDSIQGQAEAFYPLLAESATTIMTARATHLGRLDEICARTFTDLGGRGKLSLTYRPNLKEIDLGAETESKLTQAVAERFIAAHAESERLRSLSIGIHRDDFSAHLDGRHLGRFGSQGEHRLSVLALKLGLAALLKSGLGEPPILLLDDFGSELDARRRRGVLSNLRGRMQTFVTCTQSQDLGPPELFDQIRSIHAGAWVETGTDAKPSMNVDERR